MSNERLRILPSAEELQDSASSSRDDVTRQVDDIIAKTFEILQFETKEEYIKFLIEENEIQKDNTPRPEEELDLIRLKGHLEIDNRVKSGLDWSDVVADTINVIPGKITRYPHLPKARKWVKSELTAKSAAEYFEHNLFGSSKKTDGKIEVEHGIALKIAEAEKMPDFNSVTVDSFYYYGSSTLPLSKLPHTRKGIYNVSCDNLEIDVDNPYKTAKEKKLGKEVIAKLAPTNPLQRWLASITPSKSNSNT